MWLSRFESDAEWSPPAAASSQTQVFANGVEAQGTVTNMAVAPLTAAQMAAIVEAVMAMTLAVPEKPLIAPPVPSGLATDDGGHTLDGCAVAVSDPSAGDHGRI